MAKKKLNLKKIPTSKKLTVVITAVWVMTVIGSFFCLLKGINSGFILTSVSASFSVCISGYFTKSYFENKSQYAIDNNSDNLPI